MHNIVAPTQRDPLADESSSVGNKITDSATHFKNNVSELGRRTADTIDANMASAATGLDKAAATLHGRAESLPGVDTMSGLAHTTAEKLSATAGYLRAHDVGTILKDTKALVKANPGPSMLVAGVIGFLLGRSFLGRNRD